MEGIENSFILNNLFGTDEVFDKVILYDFKYIYNINRMYLDVICTLPIYNVPKKWVLDSKACVTILFEGIENIVCSVKGKNIVLNSWNIEVSGDYEKLLYVSSGGRSILKLKYKMARIQNIKPVQYIEEKMEWEKYD